MWKITIEYKANLFFNILQMFIYMTIHITSLYVIYYALGDVIGWEFETFLLFYFLSFLIYVFAGLLCWHKNLEQTLLRGEMNQYLIRPQKPFISYIFANLSGWAILSLVIRGLLTVGTIIYFNIKISNIFIVILLILLGNILFFAMAQFIDSFEFLFKRSSNIFIGAYDLMHDVAIQFPAPFFENLKFKKIMFIVPTFLVGYILIPILKIEKSLSDFKLDLTIIISIILIILIWTYLNWHYGLKRYEAFG